VERNSGGNQRLESAVLGRKDTAEDRHLQFVMHAFHTAVTMEDK